MTSFPGASTISSSSRFVVEGEFRQSGVVHSFKVEDPGLFVFESYVSYSRDLLYIRNQSVPRCKHFPPRLLKPTV